MHRQELIFSTRCSLTLVTKLRREDNNRKLRCQVSSQENGTAAFLDFTSAFLFQTTPTAQNPVQLPISRIVLCVALPVMVLIVSFFTWRGDRKRAKAFAAGMELQEINWLFITALHILCVIFSSYFWLWAWFLIILQASDLHGSHACVLQSGSLQFGLIFVHEAKSTITVGEYVCKSKTECVFTLFSFAKKIYLEPRNHFAWQDKPLKPKYFMAVRFWS